MHTSGHFTRMRLSIIMTEVLPTTWHVPLRNLHGSAPCNCSAISLCPRHFNTAIIASLVTSFAGVELALMTRAATNCRHRLLCSSILTSSSTSAGANLAQICAGDVC